MPEPTLTGPDPAAELTPAMQQAPIRSAFSTPLYNNAKERGIQYALAFCALLSVLTTLGIAIVLVYETVNFFSEVSIVDFFTDTEWTPQFAEKHFGILPLLAGTLLVTLIAAVVAMPLGVGSAIYVAQYAPDAVRRWLKPGIELLAGVPTVVYGYFALTFVTPLLQRFIPELNVFNALSAGLVMGVMIIPLVASLSEDAIRSVPRALGEGAYALGATRIEVVLRVVVPAALSGITASFILALSRAIGETMIVALAAGNTPRLTFNPVESIQTMTGFIAQVSLGDVPHRSIVYKSLFAVGLLLFLITLGMNMIAQLVIRKFQEKY